MELAANPQAPLDQAMRRARLIKYVLMFVISTFTIIGNYRVEVSHVFWVSWIGLRGENDGES